MNGNEPKQTVEDLSNGFTVRPDQKAITRFVSLIDQYGLKRSEMARMIFTRGLAVIEREGIRPQYSRRKVK